MEVKEAIEFLDHMANSFKCISSLNCKSIDNKKNEIVDLLEQGEKYRQMWQEYKELWGTRRIITTNSPKIIWCMEELEQKYFPKEAKQDKVN